MGIKFKILDELRKVENGLTVKELAEKIGKNTKNGIISVRVILNRDMKPDHLVEELDFKRDGGKVYALKKDENGTPNIQNNDFLMELLEKNLGANEFLMDFFEENKTKLQANASKKAEDFRDIINVLKETKKTLKGDEDK